MGTKEQRPLSARVPAETRNKVEQYKDNREFDSRSDAVEDLINVGLRERQAPLVSRVRERAFDTAYHLPLVAVVTVVTGWMTTALTPAHSLQIAVVLLVIGVAPLATVELWRAGAGQSELGARLRGGDP